MLSRAWFSRQQNCHRHQDFPGNRTFVVSCVTPGGNAGSDDLLFFNLFKQVTSADVSSALIKWQALEDTVSQVEAVPVDTTHQQDNHQINVYANWLLG
jgi:hypothetical protein